MGDTSPAAGYRQQEIAELCSVCNAKLSDAPGGGRCARCKRTFCHEHLATKHCEACVPQVQRNRFANVALAGGLVAVVCALLLLWPAAAAQPACSITMIAALAAALGYGLLGLRSQQRARAVLALLMPLLWGAVVLYLALG